MTRLLHLVTVMAAARLVSTMVARTATLLQSDASARRWPARGRLRTQCARVDLAALSATIQETRVIQMGVDRCRRLLLLLVRALTRAWLGRSVHEDAPLPIHRVHPCEDRLLTDLRCALHQYG